VKGSSWRDRYPGIIRLAAAARNMHAATPSLQEVDVVRQGAGFVVNMVLRLKRGYVVLVEPD